MQPILELPYGIKEKRRKEERAGMSSHKRGDSSASGSSCSWS